MREELIQADPSIMMGKPVVAGTRITVELILEKLAAGVDLRDAEEAAREARRCVKEFDFKAVYINPVPVCEHRLYDDFYEPLWTTLEDLDVPLAVHTGTGTAADQLLYYYLPRLRTAQTTVAFTMGNMLACTALIMGGVLERHPHGIALSYEVEGL